MNNLLQQGSHKKAKIGKVPGPDEFLPSYYKHLVTFFVGNMNSILEFREIWGSWIETY